MKAAYRLAAEKYGVTWNGHRYDRQNPNATDTPNQAINHAASAVEAAAAIAVAATATIPQLGFIHEDSGQSFILDVADLVRHDVTLDIAFGAAREHQQKPTETIDRLVRRRAARLFGERQVVSVMIDRIKAVLAADGDEPLEQDGGADGEPQ